MKYLGNEITKEVVKKSIRKVEYIRCDKCKKKIYPSVYSSEKSSYIHIHTWHSDWGNDSIESHERHDYCKDCAKQVVAEYISMANGTDELELQHENLFDDETYEDFENWVCGVRLVANDAHPTEKGGVEE